MAKSKLKGKKDKNRIVEEENFTAKDYIDNLLRRIFITSDFALVDLSHEDKCWKNAVNTPGQKMSNECILNEYATKSLR